MTRKLAVKRLTASDLSFFEWQYRQNPSSKQKAINLNADPFIDKLYPGLGDLSVQRRYPVDVFIYGPGLANAYNVQRKILKPEGAKNWRLNGELVSNPENDPARFNDLVPNDLVMFDFSQGLSPTSVTMIFLAATFIEDGRLHQALNQFLGTDSMKVLSPTELEGLVKTSNPVSAHPIYRLALNTDVLDSDIEDIVLGGSGRKTRASSWTPNRIVSRDDLQKAKGTVEAVGLQGEQFVNNYLSMLKSQGKIQDFAWVADENVINPYDFWVSYDGKTKVLVDVKSTQGNFERTLHISLNELLRMRDGPEHYDIYRVFSMQEVTAQLRIAKNVGLWAEQILKVLEMLPEGVFSDGISLSPTILLFNSPDVLNIEELTEE